MRRRPWRRRCPRKLRSNRSAKKRRVAAPKDIKVLVDKALLTAPCDREKLKNHTNDALKACCGDLGLKKSGKKEDLVERIAELTGSTPSRADLRPQVRALHLTPGHRRVPGALRIAEDRRAARGSRAKGEERFFRKLFTLVLAIHVEPATKPPHPPAGGVPDDGFT